MINRIDLTRPIEPVMVPAAERKGSTAASDTDFRQVLQRAVGAASSLQFSKHAMERLERRNISITPECLARVEQGVEAAAKKGCRESLVLLDELALIVSVKNQTVVTALDSQTMKNNVFTNIDSAIIV